MTFQDYYVRNCKWCSHRLVIGLCNDNVWRPYEIPPSGSNRWIFHKCPDRPSKPFDFKTWLEEVLG